MTIKKLLSTCTFLFAASSAYGNDYVGALNIDTNNLIWSATTSYSAGQVVREGESGSLFVATTNINVNAQNPTPVEDSQRWVLLVKGEAIADDLVKKIPQDAKAIFVTSQQFRGYELFDNYRDEVDAICQSAADASEYAPQGTYGAIIALSSDYRSATSPISHSHEYYLLNGTKVANNKQDFYSNRLLSPINIDENLNQVTTNLYVWTNSFSTGDSGHTESCLKTYNDPGVAQVGNASKSDAWWRSTDSRYCQSSARLYCAQK
ncbi:hypothetical protein [Pseudoalteromonas byunsanensis]|uniref:DUF1554 domain-containing protein n=1 Tax=Pseudoalteromonas byunsanensis TaxID=327939 RepID=A0A1S1N4R5_9GAMM|nr:hypothetical protein [Pseudoalteromonas byunsanensis]OHU94306.1 hypothetical protein BIW53_14580 [Pseudoalteromonas byunsanensis]